MDTPISYIVVEIQTAKDGTVTALAAPWPTIQTAKSSYHTTLGYAALSELPRHAVTLLATDGSMIAFESFEHEQSTPEAEAE